MADHPGTRGTAAEQQVQIDAEDARAGYMPRVTRYILGISLVLVVAAFAAIVLLR